MSHNNTIYNCTKNFCGTSYQKAQRRLTTKQKKTECVIPLTYLLTNPYPLNTVAWQVTIAQNGEVTCHQLPIKLLIHVTCTKLSYPATVVCI